jgi:hypothetical protein
MGYVVELSMKCVLCGGTSREIKIDQFPLSDGAREMLKRHFGLNPDEPLSIHGVCRACLNLPDAQRNKLALSALKDESDRHRRALITDALKQHRN